MVTHPERLSQGDLASPEVIAAAGAMVVLGEPGAGKTSVLKRLTEAVPHVTGTWDEDFDACLWISGGDLTESSYEAELGSHLSSLSSAEAPRPGEGTLFVVLDQLDECGPFLRLLPRRLTHSLRGRNTGRLHFLVACRTADYPTAMTEALTGIVGACRCVDLAPLSRAEAVQLADSAGVPGEALVKAAEAAGAAVMASVPLTLELLVVTYRADGRLAGKPTDLFARGVEVLAQEPNPDRVTTAVTTSHQRLAIARRIAAWTLLSGHRNVWLGRTLEAGAFDLPGDVLGDGEEATPGGSFTVTYEAVRETLATALFTRSGDNRVAFRHSSVAAYLAARYLTDRKVVQRQLENLFLVGMPDGDTASIPMPLRETAAWLVALRPHATAWLASADPESLAVHSAIVRSDEVRSLTVDRLLERAPQVELSGIHWALSRWDLQHPLLGTQLADVLEAAPAEEPADWSTTARIRLALRIAEHAAIPDARLVAALLRLVENDAWNAAERRLAASAAFACGAVQAVPVLRRTLVSLDDVDHAERIDSGHDLRGTLLDLLWPDHLDVTTMLDALRPPSPRIFNMYTLFLRDAPTRCTDEHLPDFLTWTESALRGEESTSNIFDLVSDTIETDFVDSLIDRALRSSDAIHLTGLLAKIIFHLFRRNEQAHLPECLQPASQEPLRRLLAEALVEEAVRTGMNVRGMPWRIIYDWKTQSRIRLDAAEAREQQTARHQLLDGTDFAWALDQVRRAATSPDERLLAFWGELVAQLFPRDDHEAFNLAYDEDHPAWPYVSFAYEAIDIDGHYAKALRRSHQAWQQRQWEGRGKFASEMADLLARARAGDNDSLWQFVWLLQIDPQIGRGERLSGPIHAWPGTAVAGDLHDLPELALRYLTEGSDHADSWITNHMHDKRSWAGYALLIYLHETDRLTELPLEVWGSWAAAICTETFSSSAGGIRGDLLRLTATHAAEQLAHRLVQYCQAALTQAVEPLTLRDIDPLWAPEIRTAMEHLVIDLSVWLKVLPGTANTVRLEQLPYEANSLNAVLNTWSRLLYALLTTESEVPHTVIAAALDNDTAEEASSRAAVLAAQALLIVDAKTHWSRVWTYIKTGHDVGHRFVKMSIRTETEHAIQKALDESQLVDMYLWLSELYPPENDRLRHGAHWMHVNEQGWRWRDSLLQELSSRASAESVSHLRRLANNYPERLAIAAALISAVTQYAAARWSQVAVDDVINILRDPTRRIVRTSTDLLRVALEMLKEIGDALPPQGELLWDRIPGKRGRGAESSVPDVWQPKPEAALCAYVAHELRLRMAHHGVVVNREVLIHPTDPYGAGDRTDILVEALPESLDRFPEAAEPLKLVIEVKCAGNKGLMTAQETQLVDRYLHETRTDVGIYLVGWHPIELWTAPSNAYRQRARNLDPGKLLTELEQQATQLSRASFVYVRPLVIMIPRPHKHE